MMKKLTFAAMLSLFASTPAIAQDGLDAAEAAMEAAIAAVENAVTESVESVETVAEGANAPPYLSDFNTLQAGPADYPTESWVNGEEGTTYYELAVDANGDVAGCTVIESSGHQALDEKTCEIAVARGKFQPASDASGAPIAGVHRDYQVWAKREPQFPGTATIHVRYTATEQGSITDCEVVEISGYIGERMRQTMESEPCPGMNRQSLPPYRDEAGNPVAKRVDLTIVVTTEDAPEGITEGVPE